MKKTMLMTAMVVAFGSVAQAQSTLADWTFESSGLGSSSPSETPGVGNSTTNFYAELGLQAGAAAATGLHVGNGVYTSPAGNGSTKSLSSTVWAVNDYYQIQFSTVGYNTLTLNFDQTSSGTGPGQYQLEYSLTGASGSFVDLGSAYTVLDNGLSPNASWNSTTGSSAYSFSFDLSSLSSSALDNQSTVYVRFVDSGTEDSAGTASVGTSGTDRLDNVVIKGDAVAPVPEPSTLALLGMGGAVWVGFLRRLKKQPSCQ